MSVNKQEQEIERLKQEKQAAKQRTDEAFERLWKLLEPVETKPASIPEVSVAS